MAFNEQMDNPFSATIQDYKSETPTLDRVVQKGIDVALLRVHTALPCAITSVLGNQKVNVQPLLQKRYVDPSGVNPMGVIRSLSPIQNVPVLMPMGSTYYQKFPIQAGDMGLVIFSERSIDSWKSGSGGLVDPGDTRHHDITDAVFIPGLVPFSQQSADDTTDWVFNAGMAQVRLLQNGKILLGGQNANSPAVLGDVLVNGLNDLVSALNTFATAISTGPIGIIGTPTPGSPVPTNPAIIAAVVSFAGSLSSFVSQYLTTPSTNIESQQTFLQREP